MHLRPRAKHAAIVIGAFAILAIGLFAYKHRLSRIQIIKLTSASKWDQLRRLANELKIGMGENEVADILGRSEIPAMNQSNLLCWVYAETGPGANGELIVQFKRESSAADFRLCYCVDINEDRWKSGLARDGAKAENGRTT